MRSRNIFKRAFIYIFCPVLSFNSSNSLSVRFLMIFNNCIEASFNSTEFTYFKRIIIFFFF